MSVEHMNPDNNGRSRKAKMVIIDEYVIPVVEEGIKKACEVVGIPSGIITGGSCNFANTSCDSKNIVKQLSSLQHIFDKFRMEQQRIDDELKKALKEYFRELTPTQIRELCKETGYHIVEFYNIIHGKSAVPHSFWSTLSAYFKSKRGDQCPE